MQKIGRWSIADWADEFLGRDAHSLASEMGLEFWTWFWELGFQAAPGLHFCSCPTCVYMISSISIVHISSSCQLLRLLSECKMFWQQQQQQEQHQHQHQFCMYTQGLQGRTDMFHWRGAATLPSPLAWQVFFSPGVVQSPIKSFR